MTQADRNALSAILLGFLLLLLQLNPSPTPAPVPTPVVDPVVVVDPVPPEPTPVVDPVVVVDPVPPEPTPVVDPVVVVDPVPPEPTPVVTSDKLWLVAVDDHLKRTPSQTLLLSDVAYWDSLRANGHDYEHYQAGSQDAQRYSEFAEYPASLIVQNYETGEVIAVEEIPAKPDKSWADSIVAKYSGAQ